MPAQQRERRRPFNRRALLQPVDAELRSIQLGACRELMHALQNVGLKLIAHLERQHNELPSCFIDISNTPITTAEKQCALIEAVYQREGWKADHRLSVKGHAYYQSLTIDHNTKATLALIIKQGFPKQERP